MKHPSSLSSARDFRRVISQGSTIRVPWGTIHASASELVAEPSRLGVAVPAKAGGAVVRNRIKRRLRAAYRAAGPACGYEVVVRARAEAASIDFQEMESPFRELAV